MKKRDGLDSKKRKVKQIEQQSQKKSKTMKDIPTGL